MRSMAAPMRSNVDIRHLRDEHAHLVETGWYFHAMVSRELPPPMADLEAVRHDLASSLIHHLRSEDQFVYPELLASDDPRVRATARQFVVEMGGLSDAFRAYTAKWDAEGIARDWSGFRADSIAILKQLSQRIVRENRDLYPLVEPNSPARSQSVAPFPNLDAHVSN